MGIAQEVETALRKMKNNKAAEKDGIQIEFHKNLPDVWRKELVGILNELRDKGELIKGWELACICPIFKAGEDSDVWDYRGVSLLNTGINI